MVFLPFFFYLSFFFFNLSFFFFLAQVRAIVDDTIGFQKFTAPMQTLLLDFLASDKPTFCVSSAHPRIVAGKPSKNPRYLQDAQVKCSWPAIHLAFVRIARP